MAKVGVVFANLGTPSGSSPVDVGKYLNEFLMDPYVIQMPWILRFLLVRGIIVPFRKKKSAANYQKVWTEAGSPLLVETEKAAQSLQKTLGESYKVVVGMRYGQPDFALASRELQGCEKIIFFPQYPQYAESSVQTAVDHFYKYFDKAKTKIIPPYFGHPLFIEAYVDFLKKHLKSIEFDHLLMSFHGLPESHLFKTDPTGEHCLKKGDCCQKAEGEVLQSCYRAQCYHSARKIAAGLELEGRYSVSFQSGLGRQKWTDPYTDQVYGDLIAKNTKKLAVICPGFSVDGLETLEEIAMSGKKAFMQQGGEAFHFVPCLNTDQGWIDACAKMVQET